jgi:hypothetical protein
MNVRGKLGIMLDEQTIADVAAKARKGRSRLSTPPRKVVRR